MIDEIIKQIFKDNRVKDSIGNEFNFTLTSVSKTEGDFIYKIISSNKQIKNTLEIGCAYGISSLFICKGLEGREDSFHTIIDPHQKTNWHNIGIENLKRSGINFFSLIEKPSEIALPELLIKNMKYDFIFIDGWHTFDHTLLDLFYSNRLLNIGGVIVIHDCDSTPVAKAVNYFSNYPSYEIIGRSKPKKSVKRFLANIIRAIPNEIAKKIFPNILYDNVYIRTLYSSITALKKIKEDDRDWKWYIVF